MTRQPHTFTNNACFYIFKKQVAYLITSCVMVEDFGRRAINREGASHDKERYLISGTFVSGNGV